LSAYMHDAYTWRWQDSVVGDGSRAVMAFFDTSNALFIDYGV